jgi:Phage integrase family
MDRNTVSTSWHKQALADAGLRDMPLHALRHTAAAACLLTGHPLIYVQRQLGHASIKTTEAYYGHLEESFLKARLRRPRWRSVTPQEVQASSSHGGRAAVRPCLSSLSRPTRLGSRRPPRRVDAGLAGHPAGARSLEPREKVTLNKPHRTVRTAQTDARNTAVLGRGIEPRA